MSTGKVLLSGLAGFVVSAALTVLLGGSRRLALTLGVVTGGSTAAATFLAADPELPDARDEPIRIDIDESGE